MGGGEVHKIVCVSVGDADNVGLEGRETVHFTLVVSLEIDGLNSESINTLGDNLVTNVGSISLCIVVYVEVDVDA